MSKKNTKQTEAAKTSKTNRLDKLNDKLLDLYKKFPVTVSPAPSEK